MTERNEDYQYNSCISRGICSINPRISALQTVLVLYLRMFAKFGLKLESKKLIPERIKDFILNTISVTIYNPEFNEDSFITIINNFRNILPLTIEEYYKHNEDLGDENLLEKGKANKLYEETKEIISAIQFGEKKFNEEQKSLSTETRDLYNITLIILKSLSINILDLKSFEKNFDIGFSTILKLLNLINIKEESISKIRTAIQKAAKIDNELMNLIRNTQNEHYGEQNIAEVSFSTIPNKAVLVVGSNIRELEIILENLKEQNIDIYTHDEMMLAHTFPKFSEYKRLKGQFGQGIENCLLDFATFPGPIILTKHSLHNIENLYRGRLFTTDLIVPKGVIKIDDNNFKDVIEATKTSRGFRNGKQCETITIGYNKNDTFEQIKKALNGNKYDYVFIIGLDDYSLEQKTYFEKLIKLSPDNVLIISFSYKLERNNLIHINACFDSHSIMQIFEIIKDFDKEVVIFMPKCNRNTLSQVIYLSDFNKTKIYLGKCIPILLNPTLMKTLNSEFKIKNITSAKKDLENILKK